MGERVAALTSVRATFLFANPSVVDGVARLLDLGATFDAYNGSPSDSAADARALSQDWHAVGDDLRQAMTVWSTGVQSRIE